MNGVFKTNSKKKNPRVVLWISKGKNGGRGSARRNRLNTNSERHKKTPLILCFNVVSFLDALTDVFFARSCTVHSLPSTRGCCLLLVEDDSDEKFRYGRRRQQLRSPARNAVVTRTGFSFSPHTHEILLALCLSICFLLK